MRFHLCQQGLNNTKAHLRHLTQLDNTFTSEGERMITWSNRRPGILRGLYYPLEYQALLDDQQYSLLLKDGSFFQFYYEFNQQGYLRKARLAYYPLPIASKDSSEDLLHAAEGALEKDDEILFEHLYNWTEWIEIKGKHPSNTSHIRFDFDADVDAHSPSHIQFGGVQELRLAATFFPQPLAFVQLCEALINGLEPLKIEQLGFEKNNGLELTKPLQLIKLHCS